MRSALVAGITLVLVVAGLAAGYSIGNASIRTDTSISTSTAVSTSTSTLTVTSSPTWTVIVQNGTFVGPGCPPDSFVVFMALRIPCLNYTNSSAWSASLVEYNGKDFYLAKQFVGLANSTISTTYTVWFDNATAYCVSPFLKVSELPTCPPP